MKLVNSICVLCLFVVSSNVNAFCSEPSSPFDSLPSPPSSLSKPTEPFCLSGYRFSGKHTCSNWELESYFSDVENYISDLKAFAAAANSYASEVIDYANEAVNYANCEISDLNDRIR